MLPRIRAERGVLVFMLTTRVNETGRLVGLELAADDYVAKPRYILTVFGVGYKMAAPL